MDFWSRLLAHTSLSSNSPRRDFASDPIRRLHRLEKEYGQMLQIWRNSPNLAQDEDSAGAIELRLQQLTNILNDETRRPLPHPCISFAASKQIYVPVAKIATTSYNEWIIREAVQFFATLIESEEEAFYESDAFATSLTNLLVRITGANSVPLASDTENKVVELAFNITTKIRLDAQTVLPAWFKLAAPERLPQPPPQLEEKPPGSHDRFTGRTQKQDFPLFYLLVDYIHHEGKVGDFARTGLLYIIESASSSAALEQWIVESDLSTLMATGLGALYSQLSRKLVVDHPSDNLPPILALSDYQHPRSTYEIVSSCSPEFQAHMDTFLSHLLFWQDVLNHCKSVEVKSTLLEHFQVIFLQQLLYPSLLESSDIDGGSSVAVLTYLRRILESLDHPDMINLILHYLLALPDAVGTGAGTGGLSLQESDSISAARKRKSMDLATMMAAQAEEAADPLLYNLVDLVLACLRSHSHQTIHVTLQLISTIVRRHHRYATATLLRTEPASSETRKRTIGAHKQEVDFFMSLAGIIGGQDNFDAIYEDVLRDTVARLEGHPCSLKLVAPKTSTDNHELPAIPADSLPGAPQDVHMHTIRADDPLLSGILDLLGTFFVNPVETNLSATEALIDLAVCGFVRPEGWLLRHPDRYSFEPDEDGAMALGAQDAAQPQLDTLLDGRLNQQRKLNVKKCYRRPIWSPNTLPRLMRTLQVLADQVEAYRESIPRFDELLQQRREAFQTADATISSQSNPAAPLARSNSTAKVPMTPQSKERSSSADEKPSALEGFAQRIMAELGSPSSRSASPRGRKESSIRALTGSPTPDTQERHAYSGGYGFGTPTSKSGGRGQSPQPPKEFPISYDGIGSPLRGGRSGSPALSQASLDPAIASQMEAFRAVDQQILARMVTLPVSREKGNMVGPIPLDLRAETKSRPAQAIEDKDDDDHDRQEHGERHMAPSPSSDGASVSLKGEDDEDAWANEQEKRTVTVSHVLTNTLVLQSFLLELASLVQARAGLFDEVRFV